MLPSNPHPFPSRHLHLRRTAGAVQVSSLEGLPLRDVALAHQRGLQAVSPPRCTLFGPREPVRRGETAETGAPRRAAGRSPSRSIPMGRRLALAGRWPGRGARGPNGGEGGSSRRKGVAKPPPSSWILIPLSARDFLGRGAGRGEGEGGRLAPAGRRVSRPERGEAGRCPFRRLVVPFEIGELGGLERISPPQTHKESRWQNSGSS